MALKDQMNDALGRIDDNTLFDRAYNWEPKRKHQFIMSVASDVFIPAYLIKASNKPSMTNGEIALDHINVQRYVKGKSVWNDLQITIYDAIVPSAAQAVMEWVRLHHESATGRDGYSTFYKKDLTLRQLSPLGEHIEEWKLNGAYIKEANFGELDWSEESAVEIQLTLRYDWAFLSY